MNWMTKLERKYGKYAIPNLTKYMIICYAIGYLLSFANGQVIQMLSLNPVAILHGQVWRIFTWIIIPPEGFNFFTLISLYFYFTIGTYLERAWGTFRYNVYLFSGMIFTIVGAFVFYFCSMGLDGSMAEIAILYHMTESDLYNLIMMSFSTYYICMSLMLAFAATFPDMMIYLFGVLPIKMKVMGIIDGLIIAYDFVMAVKGYIVTDTYFAKMSFMSRGMAIVFSLLNFGIFFITTRSSFRSPKQIKRQVKYRRQVAQGQKIAKHKCAICGRTEDEFPDLEFRFCSKCNGNYEYCQEHLFTHTHIQK